MYGAPSCVPDVEDREDVGMVEGAGSAGLLLETAQAIGIGREAVG